MTQNVKKSRASVVSGRAFAVLLLLGVTSSLVAGCADDKPQPSGGAGELGSGCPGPDCTRGGRFTPCNGTSECDEAHGFSCVEGECTYQCQTHADCVEVGHCDARTVDGERKTFCVRDAAPPTPGGLYSSCPLGTECADSALCLGAGPGDLDAYCSIDCSTDDDCATGYFCGTLTRPPCADACDVSGQKNDPRCVDAADIGAGKPFHCGDSGVERSVCRQREFCSPCSSDADCLGMPNQICAKDESGERICTRPCDTETHSCPWGNAATCGYFDDELGLATCSHRFGSCHGSGQTCEPCRSNDDCPGGACASSSFTGERWCVSFSTRCECKAVDATSTCNDGGCPPSPSGLPIQCIGSEQSSLFDICYAANSGSQTQLGSSPQTGCWGAE